MKTTNQTEEQTCRICCRSIYSPYVRYDERGKIHEGCVSPDHAGHYVIPSEYARWYNRPIAKQIRKGLKWSKL